ncbi:MAG TPA: hypothetical protein DCM86_18155 [Verrucomicrobiales bacterium]|nr:hypothetical protein [Verrucomicrobiales bacterium]
MSPPLRGGGGGEPIPEGVIETLPENDPRLLCDPERRFMPGVPTVVDLARRAALQHLTRLPDLPSAASRESLLRWARDRVAAPEGRPHFLSPRVHGTLGATEGAAEKISFNTEDGERLPGLLWHPAGEAKGNGQTLLIADDRGKGEVAISGLVQPLRAAGYAILAVDLRGRGETLGRYGPGYDTNFRLVANQVLAGDPLAGRRAFDLARTLDYLASRPDVGSNRVTLVGLGADALPAVLAAATDPRVHRLVIARYLHSFLSQMRARTSPPRERLGEAWNDPQLQGGVRTPEYDVDFGAVIPSVLAVADLPELLTLVAPRPVLFCDARDTAAPDAGVLLSRFRAIHEGSSLQTLRYLPAHPLDSTLLLEWLQEGGSR